MRLIKNYDFHIKTKIPYAIWPTLVHQFLEEQGLTSRSFLYYFEDYPVEGETIEEQMKTCACAKILKDDPSLGECRFDNGKKRGTCDLFFLSNIDGTPLPSDAIVFPLMQKIHRRYGFTETDLYYLDIDFFGRNTPYGRDFSSAECPEVPSDPIRCIESQPYGSGIRLHRDILGENYLFLSVDILHDGKIMNPEPYAEAMKRLLPEIKVEESLNIYLTDEEKQDIEKLNASAACSLEQCRDYLATHFAYGIEPDCESRYSIATPLKKLARKYGYTYHSLYRNCVFSLQKRTSKGKILYIEIESGPSRNHLSFMVSFCGIGFTHDLGGNYGVPKNQTDANLFLEHSMQILSEFEKAVLPSLDQQYPETPNWFQI